MHIAIEIRLKLLQGSSRGLQGLKH